MPIDVTVSPQFPEDAQVLGVPVFPGLTPVVALVSEAPVLTLEVVRPALVAELPSGGCPEEGGVLGRPEGVCAAAEINKTMTKTPAKESIR